MRISGDTFLDIKILPGEETESVKHDAYVTLLQYKHVVDLDKKQAAALIPILQRFVETGSIEEKEKCSK